MIQVPGTRNSWNSVAISLPSERRRKLGRHPAHGALVQTCIDGVKTLCYSHCCCKRDSLMGIHQKVGVNLNSLLAAQWLYDWRKHLLTRRYTYFICKISMAMPVFGHFKIFESKSKSRLALVIEEIQQTSWFHFHPTKVCFRHCDM